MRAAGDPYLEELEALHASPEWQLHVRHQALRATYRLHRQNYIRLSEFLKAVNTPKVAIALWDEENRNALQQIIEEAGRLLHNFLASAKSLVDHTRVLANELYYNTALWIQYEERKAKLASSPEQRFVQKLRNYAQHFRLPIITAQLQLGASVENNLGIEKSKLLTWKDWDAPSRNYLRKAPATIHLGTIADDYMSVVDEFYDWFYSRTTDFHKAEFAAVRRRVGRIRRLQEEG